MKNKLTLLFLKQKRGGPRVLSKPVLFVAVSLANVEKAQRQQPLPMENEIKSAHCLPVDVSDQ